MNETAQQVWVGSGRQAVSRQAVSRHLQPPQARYKTPPHGLTKGEKNERCCHHGSTPSPPLAGPLGVLPFFIQRRIALIERWLTPLFDLALRLYVASVFFKSGLTKIQDWSSTVALFQYEYQVPILPPELAALMGTAGELGLPILLALGLAGRFGAAGLSAMNVVAVISYADLSDLGRQDHVLWGALLLVTLFHGPGRWSLDHWLKQRWGRAN